MRSPRPDSAAGDPRAEVAARRLAQLAADLAAGASPAAASSAAPSTAIDVATGSVRGPAETGRGPDLEPWWADHTRLAVVERPTAPSAAAVSDRADHEHDAGRGPSRDPDGPSALPVPGRHAARRRRSAPTLTSTLARGAPRAPVPAWSPTHLAVVAVVLVVGVLCAAWWVLRDRPTAVTPVAVTSEAPLVPLSPSAAGEDTAPSGDASAGSNTGEGEAEVTVDVTGKVRRPGIVVLAAGARVVDAVEAAGGARPGVDLSTINLARLLVDGEQIVVGVPAGAAGGAPGAGAPVAPVPPGAPAGGVLVNLNVASVTELEELPEVGPVTAAAIVAWRDEHGGFTSVDELLEVSGIGEKTMEMIRPHVTV